MNKICTHCGEAIEKQGFENKTGAFCCLGCQTVYEILNHHGLQDYYSLNKNPGIKPDALPENRFAYLDTPEIRDTFISFEENNQAMAIFKVPVIHCSSCIWLLESLSELEPRIFQSEASFQSKEVSIFFNSETLKLSELVGFMAQLGYKPSLNLSNLDKDKKAIDKSLIYKLVVAGFCLGNVMLISFPEYVDSGEYWLEKNKYFFRSLMMVLSLPVVLYSARNYYQSAFQGIKNGRINIDIPIALGILVLFLRSVYEVYFDLSGGYFDSLCGLVFFMLVGKWFQKRTYSSMEFDRDFKSFYPISVTKMMGSSEQNILLNQVKKGDRLLIRNGELIPADSIVIRGRTAVDYSFITGESAAVSKSEGERVFAGGKIVGQATLLDVVKDLNQSYLTRLWSHQIFRKQDSRWDSLTNQISKYFVWIVLFITVVAGVYWYPVSASKSFQVVTAVLIVACPCALALSAPFIFGNMMRIFARHKLFVKDAAVIERMPKIDSVIFDKTGTLTIPNKGQIDFIGKLTAIEKACAVSLAKQSNHPLSRLIAEQFGDEVNSFTKFTNLIEIPGKGIQAEIDGELVRLGAAKWVGAETQDNPETRVYFKKKHQVLGYFKIENQYRQGTVNLSNKISNLDIYVLSGDRESAQKPLEKFFPKAKQILFRQEPQDKMKFIDRLENSNHKTMMVGDGLNDAGALKAANIGVAIVNETGSFSPASDAILDGNHLMKLPDFIALSKSARWLVYVAFVISLLYNCIGLGFAVTGNLSPVVAAIIMPISSISVVLFSTLSTNWIARKL